jgi:tetratricopeptide (TPR) repeat protein
LNGANHRIARRAGQPNPDFAFDQARAADYLTRALQKDGDYANTHVDLGEALARMGRVEESAQILERGAAAWPFSRDIQNRWYCDFRP